ncbi:MAG: MCE family protein [Aeromicrobium sp.]
MSRSRVRAGVVALAAAIGLSGCSFSPYDLPLPGGADLGDDPIEVKVDFRDVLDLVPQSGVRVNDVAVGKVTKVELRGWTARVTLAINKKTELPDNSVATIRQTSLLGEKFVNLAAPDEGGAGRLSNGDVIPLQRSGRNPELEEVFSAAALLFNGGGIEKTNTIVKEIGNALEGNEAEVKEFIQNSEAFLGQLNDNKDSLIVALEKVNRLAIATNNQKSAITNALDDLPEALTVINNQRDDLVRLLQSLDRLGDVATGVIRRSKADTLANLGHLNPILRELADAGDSLAEATRILLSFPFTDAIVGNSVDRAMTSCAAPPDPDTPALSNSGGACYGDYANLDIHISLNQQQAIGLLAGFLSVLGAAGPGASAAPPPPEGEASGANPLGELPDLVGGLLGGGQSESTPDTGSGAAQSDEPAPPVICELTGMCRTPAASLAEAQKLDIGRLLVGPAVAL